MRPTNVHRRAVDAVKRATAHVLATCAVVAVLGLIPAEAQANARTCERLAAQLNNPSGGSNRYAKAVVEQTTQIAKMRRVLDSRGCRARPSLLRRDGDSSCPALRTTLGKMQTNLKRLQRSASRADAGLSRSDRSRIRAAMRRAGCEFRGQRTIAEQVFGKQPRADTRGDERDDGPPSVNLTSRAGTLRTMCVRTCDGYYFPVSFSTRKTSLETDAEACANMCPGTDTQLYVQPTGNSEPEAMVSAVDGTPYKDLPRAFSFKKQFNRSCVCNYRTLRREASDLPLMSKRPDAARSARAARLKEAVRYPSWRDGTPAYPAPIAVSTTQTRDTEHDDTIIPADENPLSNRRVRIIGDAFLPTR